ncbi:MAG: nicotinate-nucleotide adenylyltransferase [Xanthomonadales bacterium]|jgi:nicotinate-nucleotide adenylyltransferase|nr:nicotinate-nucleotide adenylyltransferase [Xanthomonadales bacterium]
MHLNFDSQNAPIGILGGTFDPVHYGHLRAAVEVREMLGLFEVRMLPSARPPHRETPAAAPEHRFEMLRLATAADEFLVPDDSEMRRHGPSWMVDTLTGFRDRYGAQPLVLIIGQDAANALDSWREWRRLFELAHIAVMCRPGAAPAYAGELGAEMNRRQVSDAAVLRDAPAGGVVSMEISRLDIASTAIRALVAEGRPPLFLTPRSVIGYIREHGLYAC